MSLTGAANRRPRVLHVVRSLEVGGLERVVCELVTCRGVEDTSVACLTARGQFADVLESKGGCVHLLCNPAAGRFRLAIRLARLIRKLKPDVIHCHNLFAHAVGTAASLLAGCPLTVLTKHGTYLPRSRAGSSIHKACLRRSPIVAVSSEIRGIVAAWAPAMVPRTIVIPNGVSVPEEIGEKDRDELRKMFGWALDEFVFISVSRIVAGKRLDDLIDAFASVRKVSTHTRLVIVGDGPVLAALKRHAIASGCGESIAFLGQRLDTRSLLSAADAFVLSSDNEGLPMALLEAMAARLPVVATSVGEVPFVVDHERSGYIVPPRSPMILRDALNRIASQPSAAKVMGLEGWERVVKDFSVSSTVAKYEDVYAEALTERPRKVAKMRTC
jgi:glycosyltransferase involved in cell wall biosynthesis